MKMSFLALDSSDWQVSAAALVLLQTNRDNRITLNNASDYRTNGHYRTPKPNPNPSTLVR